MDAIVERKPQTKKKAEPSASLANVEQALRELREERTRLEARREHDRQDAKRSLRRRLLSRLAF